MYSNRVKRRNGLMRRDYVAKHGWFILQKHQVQLLANAFGKSKVIEIGAGLGELAKEVRAELSKLNISSRNYTAFDDQSWGYKAPFVVRKDLKDVRIHKADYIVMCWPEYDTPMAFNVANRMRKGQMLIYQGEGSGGCTGCDKFHDLLESNFEPTLSGLEDDLNARHKQWDYVRDRWFVYRRIK